VEDLAVAANDQVEVVVVPTVCHLLFLVGLEPLSRAFPHPSTPMQVLLLRESLDGMPVFSLDFE
jgi:hypothetical protein